MQLSQPFCNRNGIDIWQLLENRLQSANFNRLLYAASWLAYPSTSDIDKENRMRYLTKKKALLDAMNTMVQEEFHLAEMVT
ncbi:hypothetical protein N7495_000178 [Penicillium taxi]|uniref:uncharacterized protein n=1 Tax=Penicillium taxi TaxID=168475 RepID=UPI00254510F1|nr:uncharacterized protein N7495_000178 [Penicillium taxi]KAJ5907496.1 hypothetical protein N7495_000178 [Penicillium taxi]